MSTRTSEGAQTPQGGAAGRQVYDLSLPFNRNMPTYYFYRQVQDAPFFSIVSHPSMSKYIAYENKPGKDVQSYDEWLDFARHTGQTTYHVVGTCKMGSDPMAVVDDRLRVHGIAGLRFIDASIMPTLPSGNTNAPTIMVAEKGADMLKQDAQTALKAAA